MRFSLRTDYAFRVLIHLAGHPDIRVTVRDISGLHGISHNHLVKVVHHLCHCGMVTGTRGRTGGIRLAMPAASINVGDVIRAMETEREFPADCEFHASNRCILADVCRLRHVTAKAADAFMAVLDGISIRDLVTDRDSAGNSVI
ncbi:Rrf2 family transcriptional regulator [Komagataeibacter sp. FNDCF1]|uniref:RrF2 family transcriptional regulator n=1 Tax=Komagataeibacter sp. FNDCF1 TaxID=2878681 RepID=UPI001E3B7E2B|nr:Rrf2 family transcriptional regulator [Komagataeibacter sp. FNDCF1]MCE2563196.1 Rrf2 family transcriptional regulator [Komagataeibacter sp. FNDCF1]